MARPSKLSPETAARILEAVRAGNYYQAAAAAGGIDYSTLRRWVERGEAEESGPWREFREELTRAEADAEMTMVRQWVSAVPSDWRAARDFLARRWPERWGTVAGQASPSAEASEESAVPDLDWRAEARRLGLTAEASER